MVLAAHILAVPHVVVQVFQLVLGINLLSQEGIFQIFKEISVDHLLTRVHHILEPLRARVIGHIGAVVKGVKLYGQFLKLGEIVSK